MGINVKKLMELSKSNGRVGFFSDVEHPINQSTKNFGEKIGLKRPSSPINMAHLAKILNDGYFNQLTNSPVAERPFMRIAADNIKANIKSIIKEALSSDNPQEKLNDIIISYIHKSMSDGGFKANKPSTVEAKGSKPPLMDEGHLYNSVEARE